MSKSILQAMKESIGTWDELLQFLGGKWKMKEGV